MFLHCVLIPSFMCFFFFHTVDGRNPANQLRLVGYLIISRVLYILSGPGFSSINIIIHVCHAFDIIFMSFMSFGSFSKNYKISIEGTVDPGYDVWTLKDNFTTVQSWWISYLGPFFCIPTTKPCRKFCRWFSDFFLGCVDVVSEKCRGKSAFERVYV